MGNRQLEDVALHVEIGKGLRKITMRVTGGTTGDHFPEYKDKEWFCDCPGFRHGHCRHIDALRVMKNACEAHLPQVKKVLEQK